MKKIKKIFSQNTFLPYLILFEIAFILYYILQNKLTFLDPDSFYHVKMAVLMKSSGIIKDFPYLQYTVLNEYYTDHHLLYHAALVPFVTFLPPLVGVKIATIAFSSLVISFFYWFLKKMEVRGAWLYALILMISGSFVFRINLAKAQSLAIIAYLVGFYLIDRKKYIWVLVFSFIYVWLYGGWPLIFVVFFIHFFSGLFFQYRIEQKDLGTKVKNILLGQYFFFDWQKARLWFAQESMLFICIAGGVLAGIIFNPYFPKNLYFYWQQIFKIAIIGSRYTLRVGAEWYSYNPIELMASSSLAFIVMVIALTFFVLTFKKQGVRSVSLLMLSTFFLVLTVKSRRNVEYLIPSMLAFSGVSLTIFAHTVKIKSFIVELKGFFMEQKILFIASLIPIALIPYVISRDLMVIRDEYSRGQEFNKYKEASEYISQHSKKGAIVFHSDWDEFPLLFYHNSHNYYIVGLDPTFMYNYDRDLYEKWRTITTGEEEENIYSIIKNDFKAEFVFVSLSRHESMDKNLQKNFLFEEVYKDETAKVYKVL